MTCGIDPSPPLRGRGCGDPVTIDSSGRRHIRFQISVRPENELGRDPLELLVFYLFAGIVVVSALAVVALRRAMYGVLSLIVCLASLAVLFFQLGAPFISAIQVIIYAGAIMVLFVFVVMLLDPESELFPLGRLRPALLIALPAGAVLGFFLLRILPGLAYPRSGRLPSDPSPMENTVALARLLFREFLLPFEVTSILILTAVVGAVVLARRKV